MTDRCKPLVGWRLWRLREDRLHAWVVDHVWDVGLNEARCLPCGPPPAMMAPPPPACERSPGTNCMCGLWAVWDFGLCTRKARTETQRLQRGSVVIGLMAGWGTVAIHGDEGFRCQHASILCLFSDSIGDRTFAPMGRRPGWWARLPVWKSPERSMPQRLNSLRNAAAHHGVPLVALADAVRFGLLSEFGIVDADIAEL